LIESPLKKNLFILNKKSLIFLLSEKENQKILHSQKIFLRPEKKKFSEDLSPPRNRRPEDISPPRTIKSSEDLSPPRKEPPIKPEGSRKSGLISGTEIQRQVAEEEKLAREARAKLDPVAAGKGAETIYRDKKGRPLTMLNKLLNPESIGVEEEYEWGGGKKDREVEEEKKRFEEEEKGKPYRGTTLDDEKLNQEYRDAVRFGDPMAHLLARRLEKKKKKNKSLKKEYTGFCPPNRFGIRPGYEWDGVDRSNHYEANLFTTINERSAQEELALRVAQEDM